MAEGRDVCPAAALARLARLFDIPAIVTTAPGGARVMPEIAAALRRMAHAGVVTTSVASIAGQLAGDFSQPKGRAALAVLSELASA